MISCSYIDLQPHCGLSLTVSCTFGAEIWFLPSRFSMMLRLNDDDRACDKNKMELNVNERVDTELTPQL